MVVYSADARLNQIFRALAHETRRDILRRTLIGALSVSTLAADYQMSFAAVQKHVALLEEAGLVVKQADGRQRIVRAVPEEIDRARACLAELEELWRHRLEGLDALFDNENPSSKE